MLRTGATAMLDPDPGATTSRDVRVLVIGLALAALDDPAAYGGETPAESTAASLVDLVRSEAPDSPVGLVGIGATGSLAILVAAQLGDRVDRMALVAVPEPDGPLDRDDAEETMAQVTAKTLIMNGQQDPDAAAAAARWHHDHLPGSRVEMVPAASVPGADGRLALSDVWQRTLSHLAPGAKLPS